jgi:hypothetical protein
MRVTDPHIMALSYKPEGTLATEETDTGVGQFEGKRVKILPRYLTIISNTIRIVKIRPTIAPKNITFTIYFSFF